jgi:hypothetical protein
MRKIKLEAGKNATGTPPPEYRTKLDSSKRSLVMNWERGNQGAERTPGNPSPTPPASAIPDSRREEFQKESTTEEAKTQRGLGGVTCFTTHRRLV